MDEFTINQLRQQQQAQYAPIGQAISGWGAYASQSAAQSAGIPAMPQTPAEEPNKKLLLLEDEEL